MKMKVMKVMKVWELLLILSCVSADNQHEDLYISGCSDSDGENMYGMEGNEKWYADFKNQRGVDALPDFAGHPEFPGFYENAVTNQQICKDNLEKARNAVKDIPPKLDPPSNPIVYFRDNLELGAQNTLICHVTGFYPAPVKVYWTKNGDNVTEGTSTNVPFPNKDGSFSQIFRLEFIPQQGDIYSCRVTHPALTQPLTRFWDVDVKQPGVGPAVFCGLGLTVGLLGVAAGTFFLIKGNECS